MRGLLRLFTVLIVLASFNVAGSAQEDGAVAGSGNLAAMLRFVPDNDEARRSISYGDYRAAEVARPVENPPQNFEQFTERVESNAIWIAAMPTGGMALNDFGTFNEMPAAMGVNFSMLTGVSNGAFRRIAGSSCKGILTKTRSAWRTSRADSWKANSIAYRFGVTLKAVIRVSKSTWQTGKPPTSLAATSVESSRVRSPGIFSSARQSIPALSR